MAGFRCPRIRLTTSVGIPALRLSVAKVWRRSWNRMTGRARLAGQPLEGVGHPVRVEGTAVLPAEDQPVVLVGLGHGHALVELAAAMVDENVHRLGVEGYRPPSAVGLRRAEPGGLAPGAL